MTSLSWAPHSRAVCWKPVPGSHSGSCFTRRVSASGEQNAKKLTKREHVHHEGTWHTGAGELLHGVSGHVDEGVFIVGLSLVAVANLENDRAGFSESLSVLSSLCEMWTDVPLNVLDQILRLVQKM